MTGIKIRLKIEKKPLNKYLLTIIIQSLETFFPKICKFAKTNTRPKYRHKI